MELFTTLAYQFGPFFFAVLFTLIVTRTAKQWYVQCISPPADRTEKKTFRLYFLFSCYFSVFLVIVSLVWYFYFNWGRVHVFAVEFKGLATDQGIAPAEDFFVKVVKRWERPGIEVRDYTFVLVRSKPWHKGSKIHFKYWPNNYGAGPGEPGRPPTATIIPVEISDPKSFPAFFTLEFDNGRPFIMQREIK